MADPRFYATAGPFTLAEIADRAGATLVGETDPSLQVSDVAPLAGAQPNHLSFLDNRKYVAAFTASRAGACIVPAEVIDRAPAGMALLTSDAPYKSYARAAALFHPKEAPAPGVHSAAIVEPTAEIAADSRVEAGAVIAERARIGARSLIGANAVIGPGVEIGADCRIGSGATVSHSLIGDRVAIYPGARIGQDGFGFAPDPKGHVKVPQLGRVVIEDDVEIGANTTIDRGAGPDTVIGQGCWIDNLVQIAHNVQLGRGCVIVAQVGISGSTKIGDFVQIGGQAGLTGHLTIGTGARIAAQAGIMRDIEPGATYGGSPAVPVRLWHRQSAALARLAKSKSG